MSGSLSEGNLWSGLVTRWRQLRRDEGRLRLIEGLFRTATILLVAMMLAMTVDWTLGLFSVSARTALTLAALLATGLTFHQTFWKARQAPGVVPWPVPETRSESTEAASPEVRQLRGCALTLAMAVAVLVLLLLTSPRATSIYVTRFWLPFRAVSMTRVIASPVDGVTARGEPFVVTATTQGRSPLKATLFLRVDDEVQRIGLTRADTSQPFTYRLTDLREDFAYRVRSSDGQTPWHKVAVYDLPMVSVVRLRITPPAYSRLPVDDRDLLPRRCRALQGSRMEVIVEPAGPIAAAQIDFGGGRRSPMIARRDGTWRFETFLDTSETFKIRLADDHGLTNRAVPLCRLTVYEDRPPTVRVLAPEPFISLPPDEQVPVFFKAHDDFGIRSAELVVSAGDDTADIRQTVDVPLGRQGGAKSVTVRTELDLANLELAEGQILSYVVRVRDARPGRTVVPGTSRSRRIRVNRGADSYSGQAQEKLEAAMSGAIVRVRKLLGSADEQLQATLGAGAGRDARLRATRLRAARNRLSIARRVAMELLLLAAETPYAEVARQLHEVIAAQTGRAREELGSSEAGQTSEPLPAAVEQALFHIRQAGTMLDEPARQYAVLLRQQRLVRVQSQLARIDRVFANELGEFLKVEPGQDWLNPRTGESARMFEVYARQLGRYDMQLKQLLNRLAELLAGDAKLRQRMVTRLQGEAKTLRDQLTVLAQRQEMLKGRWEQERKTAESAKPAQRRRLSILADQQSQLAELAEQLHQDVKLWMPGEIGEAAKTLDAVRGSAAEVAGDAAKLMEIILAGQAERTREVADQILISLERMAEYLADAVETLPEHEELIQFAADRLYEAAQLGGRQADIPAKLEAFVKGDFPQALTVDQRRVAGDVKAFGIRFERLAGSLGHLAPELVEPLAGLSELITVTIPNRQQAAGGALADGDVMAVVQEELAGYFDQAGRSFDDLLTGIAQIPVTEGSTSSLKNEALLGELFERLEAQCRATEKSLAVIRLYVIRQADQLISRSAPQTEGAENISGDALTDRLNKRADRVARCLARADAIPAGAVSRVLQQLAGEAPAEALDTQADRRAWGLPAVAPADQEASGAQAIETYFKTLSNMIRSQIGDEDAEESEPSEPR